MSRMPREFFVEKFATPGNCACDARASGSSLFCSVCTVGCFLLLLGVGTSRGVNITNCGDDGLMEVLADQKTSVHCQAQGQVQWRLVFGSRDPNNSFTLATACAEKLCNTPGFLPETFEVSVTDPKTTTVTISAVNNTKIYDKIQIVNGSLECSLLAGKYSDRPASCRLDYVSPPENVSCEAVTMSGCVNVSCVIGSIYSSRRIYTCELIGPPNTSKNESLGIVNMTTSPTSRKIAKHEVKVSGSCQFNKTLPAKTENYDLYVSVSPGGHTYRVSFTTHDQQHTTSHGHPDGRLVPSPSLTSFRVVALVGGTTIMSLVILLLTILVIKKKKMMKRKGADGREEQTKLKVYENPADTVPLGIIPFETSQHQSFPETERGSQQGTTAAVIYESPWDAVSAVTSKVRTEMGARQAGIQRGESPDVEKIKQKSGANGRSDNADWREVEKTKEKKNRKVLAEEAETRKQFLSSREDIYFQWSPLGSNPQITE